MVSSFSTAPSAHRLAPVIRDFYFLRQLFGERSHRGLARRLISVRRRAIFVVAEGEASLQIFLYLRNLSFNSAARPSRSGNTTESVRGCMLGDTIPPHTRSRDPRALSQHPPRVRPARMSNVCVVVSLTTASFVARKTSARVCLRWCHLLWKSVCFSMCAGNTYWCHFSAKSTVISTNGSLRSESGLALPGHSKDSTPRYG